MALKREKITSKQFGKTFNGYDKIEVQAFLEWIADEYDSLRLSNIQLEAKIKEYEADFKKYEKEKEEFKHDQINAKKDIDRLKRETAKECDIAKSEAKLNAQNVLKDAYTQTKELKNDIDKLNKIKQSFIRRYQTLLRDQLDTLKVFQREFVPEDDSVKITSKPTSKKN
ncbi:MAG: DivIVA domain-containing protein [Candidatus Delongbacteria bacterium]|nr:DivIVA domain-containing protein [Candidatus Delongbacteria bacterium]